tara:strand:- start:396 stop:590 length:195 start_codon:yes stop_codon:yes gene_type:complete
MLSLLYEKLQELNPSILSFIAFCGTLTAVFGAFLGGETPIGVGFGLICLAGLGKFFMAMFEDGF